MIPGNLVWSLVLKRPPLKVRCVDPGFLVSDDFYLIWTPVLFCLKNLLGGISLFVVDDGEIRIIWDI